MSNLAIQQSTATLPLGQLRCDNAFYKKVPRCRDDLPQAERDNAVGWVKVFDFGPRVTTD
ncbi:hypothetical protein BDF19DRAFT_424652 [Syncephalis fuscata]|nr:hypothetical protein BDF19DRAFT_424652 [Syncephalis fuscata]